MATLRVRQCEQNMKIDISKTISYYDTNASDFANGTADIVFTDIQDRFLSYIPEGGYILDFGCGSGRDAKYFLSRGYQVDAVDGSSKLCEIASRNIGITVRELLFSELDEIEKYDGIWACASILHLTKSDLVQVLANMIRAVRRAGVIYASFKYGNFEGYRNDRFFTDFNEGSLHELLKNYSDIGVVEEWISSDVRPGREDEKWLNIILVKKTSC